MKKSEIVNSIINSPYLNQGYDRGYQQGRADGAREFAEWIDNNINIKIGIYDYFGNKIRANDLLAEWQKNSASD